MPSSPELYEDVLRTLSRLVFACVPPGKSTLKLVDPVSGSLDEYMLLKMPGPSKHSVSGSRVGSSPAALPSMLSRAYLDDVLDALKDAVRADALSPTRLSYASSATTSASATCVSPSTPSESDIYDALKATQESYTGTPAGAAPEREGDLGEYTLALFPPAPLSPHRHARSPSPPSMLSPSPPGISARSSTTPFLNFPLSRSSGTRTPPPKPRLPFAPSPSPSHDAPVPAWGRLPLPSRPVGLGFEGLLEHEDGTPFGLGLLPRDVSPSEAARARRARRTAAGLAQAAAHPEGPTPSALVIPRSPPPSYSATAASPVTGRRVSMSPPQSHQQQQHQQQQQQPCPLVNATTPVSYNARATPGAPARRQRASLPGPATYGRFATVREAGERGGKRSSLEGTGVGIGDELRFWAYWMTPMSEEREREREREREGGERERRPVWRP
ncbi:uncharacterized protein BXZ73DRAFT_76619 [Epithele typhae]|uniref:uncharacterized protein n=1 Tax=Epithele typhae TaxID=378194 RepID=UPI0020079166|nr:uncharacterized protein BXZ73DRAFT_76619 [Epithele typhae]KAH9936809.1 hypothetical protein BXZ73DRAFT_76619 [Epithele typhae]